MSALFVYRDSVYKEDDQPDLLWSSDDNDKISETLEGCGVRFEKWPTLDSVTQSSSDDEILAAFEAQINQLCVGEGYQTVDVINMHAHHAEKAQLRQKFLSEHTHTEDEVRFFVRGEGLFYLHVDDKVYGVHCTQGDLIGVPDKIKHWFDMGPNPDFTCIRFFSNPEGWIADYTGDTIADHYPKIA